MCWELAVGEGCLWGLRGSGRAGGSPQHVGEGFEDPECAEARGSSGTFV